MSQEAMPSLDVKVRVFHGTKQNEQNLLGFADVTIGGHFVIRGVRVLMGAPKDDKPGAPFISFPAKKGTGETRDKWFDIAHPVTSEAYLACREAVLRAYAEACRSNA